MNPASSRGADDPPVTATSTEDTSLVHEPSILSLKRAKHAELLESVLISLDSLIYVQLSILYYLDCSFGLLLLRTLVQLFLLSARLPGLPQPPTRSRLGAIVGSNVLCILLHIIHATPQAGEASRFYLNGSIIIDFVGQLGPTSKWTLAYNDLVLAILQLIMLSLVIEKRRVENAEKQTLSGTQDLEAEEAGFVRSDTMRNEVRESDEGMEMQALLADESVAHEVVQNNTHPLDEFYTGHVVLARLNVVETIARDVMSAMTATEGVEGSAESGSVFLPLFGLRWRTLQT